LPIARIEEMNTSDGKGINIRHGTAHMLIKLLSITEVQEGNENDITEMGGRKETVSEDDLGLIVQTQRIR
jgi:hypothetical protein